jgi:hypothetical protein
MVVDPAAVPVTNPPALTVATAELLLAHVTVRPESVFPLASCSAAASCTVWPTAVLTVAGFTLTDATGAAVTVTEAVPLFPSLVAVMVAEPASTPVTSPLSLTLATPESLVVQVTTRPVSLFPYASRRVAMSWTVWPAITLPEVGLTRTVATGRW